ncbi:MAG: peptidylprolyl isomerase [Bacteroidales bacterium]|nr:peptidylprolyl isomerase [Bacteroidales bacterium]
MKIEKNKVVSMHYTLKDDKGEIMDTSEGKSPLSFIQGNGQLIPGLESQLEGKEKEVKMQVTIAPADAYGEFREDMVFKVGKEGFKGEEELQVGMQVEVELEQGKSIAVVSSIEGEKVTLDLNHPLAGQTLHFDVEIMDVRDATEEELSHGHAHGEGGHQH